MAKKSFYTTVKNRLKAKAKKHLTAKKKAIKKHITKKTAQAKKYVLKKIGSHNSVISGVNPYKEKIKSGIERLESELAYLNNEIKLTKEPLFKKSLVNRKKFIMAELKVGKQFLKKF